MNDINTEEWRPVRGYEGYYEVSSAGRTRSLNRTVQGSRNGRSTTRHLKGADLSPFAGRYISVRLSRDGGCKTQSVHVLVCEAFNGPRPSPDHEARHLNGHNHDNRAANLTWGTKSENRQDTIRHGHHHELNKTHCPQGHPYDDENTAIMPSGHRQCRTCHRIRDAEYCAKNRERAAARAREWYARNRDRDAVNIRRRKARIG